MLSLILKILRDKVGELYKFHQSKDAALTIWG